MIRILIADGNELSRIALNSVLSTTFSVEDVVSTSIEMEDCLLKKQYDIILIDYTSKNFSFNDIKTILNSKSKAHIVAITEKQMVPMMAKALKIGVSSHLKKSCSVDETIDCIENTYLGKNFICGEILKEFEKHSVELENVLNEDDFCDGVKISNRELEIIKLIAEGNSGNKIAEQLFLSNHTISAHRKNIFNKLKINSTSGLVIYAVKKGIVDVEQFVFEN